MSTQVPGSSYPTPYPGNSAGVGTFYPYPPYPSGVAPEVLSTLLDGLVSYWPLDEQSGVRYDAVGDNDLTDNNTVGAVNRGPQGTVASFVAANTEYLSCANPIVLGQPRTIAWWWRVTTEVSAPSHFSVGDSPTSGGRSINVWSQGNSPNMYLGLLNGASYESTPSGFYSTDEWHFCVLTYDGTDTSKLYVDGTQKHNFVSADSGEDNNLYIGQSAAGPWDGQQGAFAIWSRVITSDERASLFAQGNGKRYADLTDDEKVGLVSYWNLDETSGTRADSHGSNDLTDNNTVGSVINAGAALDGAAASFVNANNESLSLTGGNFDSPDYSISFWHKPSTVGSTYSFLVTLGDAWNAQIGLVAYRYEDDLYVGSGKDGSGFQAATALQALTDDAWHHVVIWFDSSDSKAKMQINGGSVLETAALDGPRFNATKFRISQEPAGTGFAIDGEMDEVAIWSRVLTEDERAELYALGAGKFYPFTE